MIDTRGPRTNQAVVAIGTVTFWRRRESLVARVVLAVALGATAWWGTVLIWISAALTIWSMVYYLQKALPAIRAKAR